MAQQGSSNFGRQRGVDPPWTPPTQTYADVCLLQCYMDRQYIYVLFSGGRRFITGQRFLKCNESCQIRFMAKLFH